MKDSSTTLAEKIRKQKEYEVFAEENVQQKLVQTDDSYRVLLKCKCETEYLAFDENVFVDGEVEINATFFHGALSIEQTLWQRLYAAYCVIRYGRALLYDFIFSPTEIVRLRDWLNTKYPVKK